MRYVNPRISALLMDVGTASGQFVTAAMDETKKAQAPDVLCSGGVGPCIVIAIHDPVTQSGYMSHDPEFNQQSLDVFINTVQKDYRDLSRVRVMAYGGSMSMWKVSDRAFGAELELRDSVEDALNNLFSASQLQIHWLRPAMNGALYLYTETGEFIPDDVQ